MDTYTYRIIIEPDDKNTFHAYVPALSGCHTWASTIEETRENIRDAIDVYLRSLKADGEKIPEDKGIEVVETISALPSLFQFNVDASGKNARISGRQPIV